MRVVWNIVILVLVLVAAAPLVLWIGAVVSLDYDLAHSQATAELPAFETGESTSAVPTLCLIEARGMTFRARAAGFGGSRGNVILLHGFPESSAMYAPMIPELAASGLQVVAFDQRGYSPGARPAEVRAYTVDELAADVYAVADAVGFETFHLVGHDWGAAVGWVMVFENPPRIRSFSALSIPHMGAYAEAINTDADQQERSAYVGFFRMPWLPEVIFSFNRFALMKRAIYAEHASETLDEYLAIFSEPRALTAALNWYRASGLTSGMAPQPVSIPTAFIWGNQDPVVGARALEAQKRYFDGNLWETELDTGHWLLETEPQAVTDAVLAHIGRSSNALH